MMDSELQLVNYTEDTASEEDIFVSYWSPAVLQETPPPPLFRSPKRYGTPKRVRYGQVSAAFKGKLGVSLMVMLNS